MGDGDGGVGMGFVVIVGVDRRDRACRASFWSGIEIERELEQRKRKDIEKNEKR